MLASRAQQAGEAAELTGSAFRVGKPLGQMRQMDLDQLPGQRLGPAVQGRERLREQGDRADVGADGRDRYPGRQPPAGPPFGQLPQPQRLDCRPAREDGATGTTL